MAFDFKLKIYLFNLGIFFVFKEIKKITKSFITFYFYLEIFI